MKKIVTSFIASIALVSTLSAADFYATVDGDKITKQDIDMLLQDPRVNFDQLPQEAKSQVLEGAINRKLIAKKAIKDGIEKDSQYVEEINSIKESLALQIWQSKEIEKIKFSDTEKRDFYEKNKARFVIPETFEASHILVDSETDAKNIIKEIEKASNKDAKFKELAQSKSKDPNKVNGGQIPRFAAEQMVPEFASAVKALAKGAYSKTPTKTQFGYHVIFVKDKIAGKSLTYDEVKNDVEQILTAEKFNKKIDELVQSLRKDAKIVIK
ncbi:peptidylprolyl isomerase [Aliarcobacter vitoriensis]|uniref:Peptidylprolyl isomerase n=1 Tax=Aliarcobacter vitoriensis TaxID=2011099 RepID=A0A366MSX6_9BACT|nr:peptidyl-prolyl cis-trans isomerase [Aliarcobacter vitoriensis]RBQ29157.1 peptidylprolyl isomerase [Aliarcobacter vitoriensis]RBQ32492.1 peptidylprolyl isomerase [Arcobacter sp. FW59]